MIESIRRYYCRLRHTAISRPVNGVYRCWECHRVYSVDWADSIGSVDRRDV